MIEKTLVDIFGENLLGTVLVVGGIYFIFHFIFKKLKEL